MVLSRNVPEWKQDLRHSEAEQRKREDHKKTGSGCDCRVAGTTTSDEDSETARTEMGDAEAANNLK